jgi:hypothetical protein
MSNLLAAIGDIADREHQERRWLAPDAQAWECPDELICVVEDCVFEGFLHQYAATFSGEQLAAACAFRDEFHHYCDVTPSHLDPATVLEDSRWEGLRTKAVAFVAAFRDKWPIEPL